MGEGAGKLGQGQMVKGVGRQAKRSAAGALKWESLGAPQRKRKETSLDGKNGGEVAGAGTD